MLNAMPSASANITRTRQIGIRQLSLSGRCRLGRATELVFVLATGAVLTIGSQAQGQTWDGGGANASWGTAENWDTDSVPNVWGIFTIDGAGGSKQPVVDTNQSATFTQVLAGTLTVNATLTSPVTVAGTGVLTINTGHQVIGIVSANGPNAVVNNNGTVTGVLQLSNGTVNNAGAVAGGTSLYGGTLNLNAGSNLSDTQALTINVGTVNVNVTDTVGSLSLQGGTVTGLGTLTVNGAMAMSGGTIASGATVNAGGAKTLTGGTIVGTLGGAGSTTITGTVNLAGGTLTGGPVTVGAGGTLNTAGVVNAATTVSGGTLNLNGGSNLSDTQALTVDGGTVNVNTIDTVGSLSGTGGTINFSPGGRLTVNQAVDGSFAGGMSGNDAFATSYFEKHGAGTLTLTGTSTVAGVGFVQILDGTLRVSGGNAISNTTVVLIGDATLELLSDETIGALWTTSGATVNLNANTLTIGGIGGLGTVAPFGVITGTGSLVYTAADLTSLFSGAFTYTGDTTISAGTFVVGVNDLIADASDLFVTGGTLNMEAYSDTVASLSLQGGSITGNGGTLNVNGAMAMSGGTIASGATVNAGGARTLSGGTIAGTLGGAGAATITGTVNLAGGTLTGGPVTVAAGGTLNTSGVVTAAMTVSGGTLNLNGGSNLSDTQALTVDGGTVNVNTIDTVGSLSGTGGTINFGADNISTDVQLIVDQAVDGTYAGGMSGNTSFNATYFLKRGGGTLTLSGTSAVTGPGRFQITNGTLQVSGGNAIGNRSIVRIGNATLELLSDETIGALNSPAGSTINLNGNTLTLAGLGGSTNVGNGSLITGSGNFVHAAPGMTSTFGTAFTYTGDTTISAGTFRLGVNDLISDASDVFVTGGTLDLNGNSDTVASLSLQSGRVTGTGTLTVNGAMTMSGGNLDANTTVNAAGQKTLTGGTITGTLGGAGSATITGTVNLANGGTLTGGPVTVGAGGTLSISLLGNVTSILSLTGGGVVSATTDITLTSSPINVANGGTFTAAAGRTLTLQTTGFSRSRDSTTVFGTAGVDGTVVLNATGVVGIDQNSVFRVAGGTLRLGTGALVNFLTSGIAEMENIVDAGATLDMNGRDRRIERLSGAGTVTNSGTSAITLDLSNRLVATNFAGVIRDGTGAVGLTKTGAETLTLTGNNIYTGTTTISGGTLQVGNGGATGSLGAGNIVNNAALVFDRSDDITVGNTISGNGSLTKQGAGRLTLSGANTYSGATHIDAGVLLLTGANLGNGAGAVTVAAGAALELAFAATPVNPMTISGAGSGAGAVVGVGANSSLDGTITLAADAAIGVTGSNILNIGGNVVLGANTLTLSGAGTRFVTGNISGTGGLTHAEGMTLFSGTGTYLGPTTLTGGTMVIRSGTAIQDQGAVIVNAGTLRVNLSETVGSIAGAGAIQIDTSQTLTTGGNNATTSVSGVITGAGGLTKQGSGTLTLTGNNSYTGATTITGGTLSLGNMGGTGALAAASDITINSAGTLELARNDSVTIANTITGAGRIAVSGGGTTILSGASTGFAGALDVTNGTARVTGSLGTGATVTVGATGILQGTGTIGGNVTVQDGGTLAAGASPGVLTVAGDLVLSSGSISAFELGAANITGSTLNDLVIVTGNLTLDGLLNLVADPLADGYYSLFSYGGNLTDNGLMLGVLPIGTTATVLTNVAGEVNLRVGVATGALFWDGGVANASNGTINGGTGTWNATEANWTIANGSFNDGWTGGDAIFGGTAGTVTVAGTQAVAGIAFTTSGYTLTAGALNLASATSRIDVLAGGTANINTALSGSSDLQKTGGGTLILGGDNSYAGTTMISTGTLTITHGNALGGTAAGTVVADGATLALSGAILTAEEITLHGTGVANGGALRNLDRDNIMTGQITLGSAARINSDAGALSIRGGITGMNTDLTIGGADVTLITGNITTGTGGLTKDGSGTVLLAGVNTFTGALNLVAGDMQVDGGQAIADSVAVTLASGTSLRVRGNETVGSIAGAGNIAIIDTHTLTTGGNDGATTFSGVISGATGSLTKAGTGRLTLTGTNTYTGTTTISEGTLQVGNGGTTGSLGTGNIVNNAALVFDRSDDITLGNAISGSGTLTQAGAGRLTLTGTHTHTGGTTIAAGVLRVAATGALGSGTVTVTSGTVLELATDGTFANAMTVAGNGNGNGAIELIAPGSNASLNGVITLAGDSTINAGAGTLNVGGTITGAGHALSFGGAGTTIVTGAITTDAGSVTNTAGDLSLQGTNSYTGDTALQGGRLLIAGGNAISDMGAVILNAGRLVVEDSETVGAISGAGDVTIHEGQALTAGGNNATTTLSGVISGAGGLTKQGSGKLTLTATHTYTGATTVEAGQLDVTGAIASALVTINGGSLRVAGTSLSDTATVTLAGTGTLSLTGSETFGRLTSATGAGLVTLGSHSLTLTGGADALFGGSIGGTGGVSITGGTHVWSGAHGYTGTTTISAGVLRLGANDVLADLSGLVISGGQFDIAGFNDILGTLAMSAGSITGTGRMTARSAHLTGGTLATTLEATETEVSSGRVVVTGSIEGAVTLGTGAILELGSDSAVTGPITASADGTEIIYGDGLDLGAALILGAGTTQLTVASTDAATQSGAISGSGAFGIDKAGSGTLILTGTNSYAGTTTISGGILQVGNGGATGSLGAGAVTNDGALVFDWSNSLSVANAISGTGGLTQAGTGTLTLTGPNSFTGDTLVNAGSLVLGGGAAIHDAGVITVAYGAVLELRESETIGQLVNRGRVTLSGATPVAGTVLTVAGDYSANSELELDVVLGGDGSASDRLVVMGATSGTTNVIIRNQGGTGASTRAGIMLVEVQGASEGSFVLANGDVVLPDGERGLKVGNHVYVLRDVAGNWLLQSRLAGGLEVFQALPGAMQGLVRADSMGQRTAGRITGAGAPAASGAITMSSQGQPAPTGGAWVSLGGGRFDVSPQGTESGLSYSQSTQRIAAGFDMPLYQGASGRWVGGIGLFSGNSDVSATSDNGGGTIASKATGVSLTASWPGDGGFYADLQFALARLSAGITTADGDRLASGLGGRARMASVEIGQSVHLQDGLVLTSQAQLSWSEIRIDSFTAAGGAAVQVGQTDGLALRLGLAAEQTWATDAGAQARVYGIANITHELEGDSNVLVDGTAMTAKAPDWTAEFGLGGSLDLPGANRGQTKLYGEITGTQALSGGSMTGLSGSLGVRVTW